MKMANEFIRMRADQNGQPHNNNMYSQPYGYGQQPYANPYGQPVPPYGYPQQPYAQMPQQPQQQQLPSPQPQVQPIIINTAEQPAKPRMRVIDADAQHYRYPQQGQQPANNATNYPPDSVTTSTTTTTTRVDTTKGQPQVIKEVIKEDGNDFYDIDGFYDNYDGTK